MAFLSHRHSQLFAIIVFFSNIALAQEFIACPHVNATNTYTSPKPHCGIGGGSQTITGFSPCVVRDWSTSLHQEIQASLVQECEVEKQVRQMELNHEQKVQAAHFGGHAPPKPPKLSSEVQDIMHRLDPQNFSPSRPTPEPPGTGPYRQDSCLADTVQQQLEIEAKTKCVMPSEEILPICRKAVEVAGTADTAATENLQKAKKIEAAANLAGTSNEVTFEEACERENIPAEDCSGGPVQTVSNLMASLEPHLSNMLNANTSCSTAITRLGQTGCFDIYEHVFNNPEQKEYIAKYCTNKGLYRNVTQFINYMENDDYGPLKILKRLSSYHHRSRGVESTLAAQYDYLATVLEQLEKSSKARETAASDPEE